MRKWESGHYRITDLIVIGTCIYRLPPVILPVPAANQVRVTLKPESRPLCVFWCSSRLLCGGSCGHARMQLQSSSYFIHIYRLVEVGLVFGLLVRLYIKKKDDLNVEQRWLYIESDVKSPGNNNEHVLVHNSQNSWCSVWQTPTLTLSFVIRRLLSSAMRVKHFNGSAILVKLSVTDNSKLCRFRCKFHSWCGSCVLTICYKWHTI